MSSPDADDFSDQFSDEETRNFPQDLQVLRPIEDVHIQQLLGFEENRFTNPEAFRAELQRPGGVHFAVTGMMSDASQTLCPLWPGRFKRIIVGALVGHIYRETRGSMRDLRVCRITDMMTHEDVDGDVVDDQMIMVLKNMRAGMRYDILQAAMCADDADAQAFFWKHGFNIRPTTDPEGAVMEWRQMHAPRSARRFDVS